MTDTTAMPHDCYEYVETTNHPADGTRGTTLWFCTVMQEQAQVR